MIYHCCSELRRNRIQGHPTLNGIDFLEVTGDPKNPSLEVNFINDLAGSLPSQAFTITGGEKIDDVAPQTVTPSGSRQLVVTVNHPGDFSICTLRIHPPAGSPIAIDDHLNSVDFSFKTHCPSEFDCEAPDTCLEKPLEQPVINYLAKDYASFRQLMLDRLSVLMPDWQERSPADLNITLVELLAYVGDYLSYRQDAVATEAYLGTARRRVSIRRHARLVDYPMHDGCSARAWVQVQVSADSVRLERGTPFFTRLIDPIGNQVYYIPGTYEMEQAAAQSPVFFEALHDARLYKDHNQLNFYTWGETDCFLAQGAVSATLTGHHPNLKAGDVLVLMEVRGALTGDPADALPARRHAVMLRHVQLAQDPLGGRFLPIPNDDPVPVTEIAWTAEDALPFSLCLAKQINPRLWGRPDEVLPAGAFSATLQGHVRSLTPGDTVIFSAVSTSHSLSVQLTGVSFDSASPVQIGLAGDSTLLPVTHITWSATESLPAPMLLSETRVTVIYPSALALGNMVLGDHGKTEVELISAAVPEPSLFYPPRLASDHCRDQQPIAIPVRYRPALAGKPLACAVPYRLEPLFQLPFSDDFRQALDLHQFNPGLQAAFAVQGIGFSSTVSIQGSGDEWSISEPSSTPHGYRIRWNQRNNTLAIFGLDSAVETRRSMESGQAIPQIVLIETHKDLLVGLSLKRAETPARAGSAVQPADNRARDRF
jgi:hypothetical protein